VKKSINNKLNFLDVKKIDNLSLFERNDKILENHFSDVYVVKSLISDFFSCGCSLESD